jgi:hypothetical protein
MDQVQCLIRRFQAHDSRSSVALKLDVLMDLEQVHDRRALEFMLQILANRLEPDEVRMHVLKGVRNGRLAASERPRVAGVFIELLGEDSSIELRLQAALALGEFTDVRGVVAALGALANAPDEMFDLGYAAFTALDGVGPMPEYLTLLHQLADDETLGYSARSVLHAWAPRNSTADQ